MKEFNLSEKGYELLVEIDKTEIRFKEKDVKEFIREIKNMVRKQYKWEPFEFDEALNKLAGEKLIK